MQICTARGEASLAADRSPAAARSPMGGSVSRPRMEHMNDRKVIIGVDLVRGQHAVFYVDFEDGDRDHEVAGELEGVGLSEGKIVRHVRGSIWERANSRSMAPQMTLGRARSPRGRSPSGRSVAADPLRVDRGRSGPGSGRHHKRAGLACFRMVSTSRERI